MKLKIGGAINFAPINGIPVEVGAAHGRERQEKNEDSKKTVSKQLN